MASTTLDLSNLSVGTSPYTGFDNQAAFVTDGGGTVLRLTTDTVSQDAAGSAFSSNKVAIQNDTSFTAQFTFETSTNQPDGVAFILHNDPNGGNALGDGAPGLGYQDFENASRSPEVREIVNAIVVEFDTYTNGGIYNDIGPNRRSGNSIEVALIDGNGDRILLDENDQAITRTDLQKDLSSTFDFNDTTAYTAWVEYDGATQILRVFVAAGSSPTKPATAELTVNLSGPSNNLQTVLGSQEAHIGFTASASEGAAVSHDVTNFNFVSTAANTAPILAGNPTDIFTNIKANEIVNIGISDLAVTDNESANIASATVAISGAEATESLGVGVALPAGVTSNYINGVLTITGAASTAEYTTILRNITYQNSVNNLTSNRTITFSVSDGQLQSNSLSRTLGDINVAPSLTGNPVTVGYTEGDPALNVGIPNLNVSDADGDDIVSAEVAIADAEITEFLDVSVALPNGLSKSYSNGVLKIEGIAPVAAYANILSNVTYLNVDDTPPSTRTLAFSVNDGELNSNQLFQTVNVTDIPEETGGETGGGETGGGETGGENGGVNIPPSEPTPTVSLIQTTTNLLGVKGTEGSALAEFSLESKQIKGRFEVNIFKVDDELGTIDGVSPGSSDYILKALQNGTTLFGTTGDSDIIVDSNRLFSLSSGHQYGFVILPNNTRDSFLAGNGGDFKLGLLSGGGGSNFLSYSSAEEEEALFLNWNLDNDNLFDDLKLKVKLTGESGTILGSSFQGGFESEVLDLTGLFGEVELVFEVKREAKFDNLIGFYKADEQGNTRDEFGNLLSPGDDGYIQAAVKQWQNQPGITGRNGRTVTRTAVVEGGYIYAPFLIANGTIEQLLDSDASNDPAIYFPYLGANSDGADHIVLLGDNKFGFEDLPNGGDQDFDDMVITTKIRPVAA